MIIADEPTTALDVTIQAQILLLLQELQSEFDMGLILITHDPAWWRALPPVLLSCMRVRLLSKALSANILQSDAPLYAWSYGCIPVPGKTSLASRLALPQGCLHSVGKFTGCRFAERCDHVTDACCQSDIELRAESGETQGYRCIIDAKEMEKVA